MKRMLSLIAVCLFTLGMLAAQSVTVTSPNGGESMMLGQLLPFPITWSASGLKQNIRIVLLKHDGSEFGLIKDNLSAGSSPFQWTVGKTDKGKAPAGYYKIRVAAMDGSCYDVSNAFFTIAAWQPPGDLPLEPSLKLLSPNGNEEWGFQSMQSITWKADHWIGTVQLNLFQNGQFKGIIAMGLPSSQAAFSWKTGQTQKGTFKGPACKVRIVREYPGNIVPLKPLMDESAKPFIIAPQPFLHVISPDSGCTLMLGGPWPITWKAENVSQNVKIVLFRASGQEEGVLIDRHGQEMSYLPPEAPSQPQYHERLNWDAGRTDSGYVPQGYYKIKVMTMDESVSGMSGVFRIEVPFPQSYLPAARKRDKAAGEHAQVRGR